jgi:hypothetical protein
MPCQWCGKVHESAHEDISHAVDNRCFNRFMERLPQSEHERRLRRKT